MTAPTPQDVIRHLQSLRRVLQHALKAEGLPVERFNDATAQLKALDAQLKTLELPEEMPQVTWPTMHRMTRAHRRAAKRSQGNTLTQRMARK